MPDANSLQASLHRLQQGAESAETNLRLLFDNPAVSAAIFIREAELQMIAMQNLESHEQACQNRDIEQIRQRRQRLQERAQSPDIARDPLAAEEAQRQIARYEEEIDAMEALFNAESEKTAARMQQFYRQCADWIEGKE